MMGVDRVADAATRKDPTLIRRVGPIDAYMVITISISMSGRSIQMNLDDAD